jgi:hypothetical protein
MQLMAANPNLDWQTAMEMAQFDVQREDYLAGVGTDSGGGYAPDYSREVAQINAEASRDVQRMQVDADRYTADKNYQAAVDVATKNVDGQKYLADMAYRQAVDAAQISADAERDIAQGRVDVDRYTADMGYRQAVDSAKITAYSDMMSAYYGMLGKMQQAPADWIAYWYASQGQQLPQGYQGAGIPEGLAIPAWLQGAYENAGTQANRTTGLLPQEPELLGPAEYQQTPVTAWYESLPGYQGASASQQGLYRTLDPWQQRALGNATPEQMRYIAGQGGSSADRETQRARERYAGSTAGEREALANATPEQLAALWRAGQTPAMAGGGRMTIKEPAIITGMRSGRAYATLAENKPEEVKIRPLKRFASGGAVSATPSMPPWLENLTYDRRQRYPGAQLAGTPPIPSAQYMRGASQSQLEGLGGTAQAAGAYLPDWWDLVQYLAPKGTQFSMPTRNVFNR